jgi:DNA-nicking Smr family endonuclease
MTKRILRADEVKLWSTVTSTVRPGPGRVSARAAEPFDPDAPAARVAIRKPKPKRAMPLPPNPDPIEPNRKKRIVRDHDAIAARLDLHGLDQDRAREVLHGFLVRQHAEGARAVLIITGKGMLGDGILRRRVPEWLAEPPARALVAGLSAADRRHGGEGALYVALKRRV